MLSISHLTKTYGSQRAVDDLSLEVRPGEILGFLGPNGAGKTTTMKIVTGYVAATEGEVTVCGHSVHENSMAVRRNVGYLPEHNPLYKDQYVREFLLFVARTHGIKNKSKRVDELIDMTGLGREQHKKIQALSKGYRQRVGLAQALMHDPPVLILDEPTSGLDPNQLVDIRQLIRDLGREKTVVFSTHIMQEVQALCDRVVIINQGKLVADDPIAKLEQRISGERRLHLQLQRDIESDKLRRITGVRQVEKNAEGAYLIVYDSAEDVRPAIFQAVVDDGGTLLEMQTEKQTVEDVFHQLTRS